MNPRALLAGGGIGGLTAALALRRAGFEVRVLERAAALQAVGAGLTVQPNAVLALRTLDARLADAVVAAGHVPPALRVLDPAGRPISEVDATALYREVGAPGVALHRARLHELLLQALGSGHVETGAEVAGFELRGDRVAVRLSNGAELDADVVVGADGLRSTLRGQLLHDGPPRYAGYTSWRGVAEGLDGLDTTETWGPGCRFGVVPIGARRVYWFATANAPAGETESAVDTPARLDRLFGRWHAPIPELLAATPDGAILRTDIADRAPARVWGQGRFTLLGDAAHPMTPNLGQGACQAIEDAVVLGRCLAAREGGLEAALRRHERLRQPRSAAVTVAARRLGALGQLENTLLRGLRDTLLRAAPQPAQERQVARLWRFA